MIKQIKILNTIKSKTRDREILHEINNSLQCLMYVSDHGNEEFSRGIIAKADALIVRISERSRILGGLK